MIIARITMESLPTAKAIFYQQDSSISAILFKIMMVYSLIEQQSAANRVKLANKSQENPSVKITFISSLKKIHK
jgi:hypothetical protein